MKNIYYILTDVSKIEEDNSVKINLNIINNSGKLLVAKKGIYEAENYEEFANSDCTYRFLQDGVLAFIKDQYTSKKVSRAKDVKFYAYKSNNSFYIDMTERYENLLSDMEKHGHFMQKVAQHTTQIMDDYNTFGQIMVYVSDAINMSISSINKMLEDFSLFKFTMNVIDINPFSDSHFSEIIKIEIIQFN